MAADDYTSLSAYRIFREYDDDDTIDDALISSLIPGVSRAIDDHCHRWFWPKTATMVYDFQEPDYMMLRDDLESVSSIVHALNETLNSQYYLLYPNNGPPYRWIEINTNYGYNFRWVNTPQKAISITGVWGYLQAGATPSRITMACNSWINYLITVARNAGVKSKKTGDHEVTYAAALDYLRNGPPSEVAGYLAHFIKRTIGSNVKW